MKRTKYLVDEIENRGEFIDNLISNLFSESILPILFLIFIILLSTYTSKIYNKTKRVFSIFYAKKTS